MLQDKTILITGGTGSLGHALTKMLLQAEGVRKIIIFSRDEWKQHQMTHEFHDDRLRFFIGDVRDAGRLRRAFKHVDILIHTAALKQVPAMEYNPYEAVKTNILGTQNVIEAAIDEGVKKAILISTDKAVHPVNLYGATKLCAEKLFIAGNSYASQKTLLSVVRYGNVLASRGSILEILAHAKENHIVNITDPAMTRFWITLPQAVDLVMVALKRMEGGEIFIPKVPSMKLADLFEAVVPQMEKKTIGIRPGEKVHETLLTPEEARHALELPGHYVVLPEFVYFGENLYEQYRTEGKPLPSGFSYSSNSNTAWLTKESLLQLLKAE